MRAAALQAGDHLTEEAKRDLVRHFESYRTALCCSLCRPHYASNFSRKPYTMAHASDPAKGLAWIQELREEIRKQQRAEVEAHTAASAHPDYRSPCMAYNAYGHGSDIPDASNSTPEALYRQELAIKAALDRTAKNHVDGACECSAKLAPVTQRPVVLPEDL
jgi:hypothetical protein